MERNIGRFLIAGLFLMVLTSVECSAQLVTSFEQLQLLVKPGDNILVTDASGKTTKGRLVDLSSASMGLVVGGTRRNLFQTDVREIRQWRRDSLKNGALIGTAVGGGIATLALASSGGCDCPETAIAAVALAAGMGVGIGVGLDALIPTKQLIFFNPNRSSAGKFQIKPILNQSNRGVKIAFSF